MDLSDSYAARFVVRGCFFSSLRRPQQEQSRQQEQQQGFSGAALPIMPGRSCRFAPAKPGPGAGVLRNTGLVFGHDMRYGSYSRVRSRVEHMRGKPEYKSGRAAPVSETPVITGTPNQQPDI